VGPSEDIAGKVVPAGPEWARYRDWEPGWATLQAYGLTNPRCAGIVFGLSSTVDLSAEPYRPQLSHSSICLGHPNKPDVSVMGLARGF
jgi:hypothetical protein